MFAASQVVGKDNVVDFQFSNVDDVEGNCARRCRQRYSFANRSCVLPSKGDRGSRETSAKATQPALPRHLPSSSPVLLLPAQLVV